MRAGHTAVILLNWNGWRDTVECIASLLRLQGDAPSIVVCDNASPDDSWLQMLAWCQQHVPEDFLIWERIGPVERKRVTLIQTGSNLGFAGGCNVGIRFALRHTACDYVWLLNNDTVVQADSLMRQVEAMQRDTSIGLMGSTLMFFDKPQVVQCFGGLGFNFWTARVRPFPVIPDLAHAPSVGYVEEHIRYVSGASTLVSRGFIEAVGLLNEQYFLYFEEVDWAVRGRAFRMSYCPESIVFHKEGRSIGSSKDPLARSQNSERWLTRNRILFMRTYFPWRTPVVVLWVACVAVVRALQRRGGLVRALLAGAWQGCTAPIRALPGLEHLGTAAKPPV